MNWLTVLFAALGALGTFGGVGSLFYVRATSRKLNAEAHKYGVDADVALSGQALEWLKETRQMAVEADAKAERCGRKLDALEDYVSDVLEPMMREANLHPPPFVWPRPL